MQSAPKRTRSSAKRPLRASQRNSSPRRSIGLLLGADDRARTPGCRPGARRGSRCSCATRSSVSAPAFTRSRTGGPPSRWISGRVISIAMSFGVSSRPSTRPFTVTIASGVEQLAVLQHRLREHHHLDRGGEVFEHERRHEVAALGVLALQRGDDAGDGAHRAVVELGEVGDRALDVAAQRPLGAHQRVVAHVEAEHLLLGAQPLASCRTRCRGSAAGRRTPARRRRRVAAQVEQAHRARVALAPAAQRRVDDRLEHRAAGPCADGRASRTRPPLISDSIVRLLSTAGRRARRSRGSRRTGRSRSRSSISSAGHALADVAHRRQPEPDRVVLASSRARTRSRCTTRSRRGRAPGCRAGGTR